MRVFDHPDMYIDYLEGLNMLIVRRLGKKDTSDETYKKLLLDWLSQIETYNVDKQLVDYSNFDYNITPEMQVWVYENLIVPSFKAGMRKVAFVVSHNYFSQVSIEETMKKSDTSKIKIKYFDEIKKAEEWLFNK